MEQRFQSALSRHPEIEKCYRAGLINRRALARYLVQSGVAEKSQFDAAVAMLRRFDFGEEDAPAKDLFREIRVTLKDRILILDFAKEKALLERLQGLIAKIDYDKGDTLKVVVGTASVKLFIDQAKEAALHALFERFKVQNRAERVSEISMAFPESARRTRAVLSVITRELALHGIEITELLTASPELLIYLKDEHVTRAYEVIRTLQGAPPDRRVRG